MIAGCSSDEPGSEGATPPSKGESTTTDTIAVPVRSTPSAVDLDAFSIEPMGTPPDGSLASTVSDLAAMPLS